MGSLSKWQFTFGAAFFIVLLFIWGNEVADFPHLCLGAPATPINWQEAIIETVFSALFGVIAYRYISKYEKKWLNVLSELHKLADFDALTGVLSRREFIERLSAVFAQSVRSGVPFVMIMIDFDNFKEVNDRFGHLCGDKVLTGFITAVKRHVRPYDLVGRLGGDEFGVVLTDASRGDAVLIQQRIIEEWGKTEILADNGQKIAASVSMGVTVWNVQDSTPDDVIRRADMLLYRAKGLGRDRIEVG